MQSAMNYENARPHIERMADGLWPILRQTVTPIVAIKDGETKQWGTGTFFRIADDSFLVTASHVWETASRCGYEGNLHVFNIAAPVDGGVSIEPVPLAGKLYRANDPPDVAVFELNQSVVSKLTNCRFLRLSDVGLRPVAPGFFWVFGYPCELAGPTSTSTVFKFNHLYLGVPLCNRELALDGFDPKYHFLLEAARDDLWLADGSPAELPRRLDGISGCSVWQTAWPAGGVPSGGANARIVGVQTSYYRSSSVIRATPWAAVANVLYQKRSDLRDSIEMSLGPP